MTVFVDLDVAEQLAVATEPQRSFDPDRGLDSVHRGGVATAPPRTILVAEEDVNTRRALRHYLLRSGYLVAEATTAPSSFEAVTEHPADLVILDFDQTGTTADALSKIRRRSTVPVIVCSGRATERERSACSTSVPTTS